MTRIESTALSWYHPNPKLILDHSPRIIQDFPEWMIPMIGDNIQCFMNVFESRSHAANILEAQDPSVEAILDYSEQNVNGTPLWLESFNRDRKQYLDIMLPGFVESVHATALLRRARDEITSVTDSIPGVVNIGSLAWGAYYATKMNGDGSVGSDLDMEFVVDTNEGIGVFDGIISLAQDPFLDEGLKKFYYHFEKGNVDYFSHKIQLGRVSASLHITPIQTLANLFSIDQVSIDETFTLREFRVRPKSKPSIYFQRSFSNKVTAFVCGKMVDNEGAQITFTPGQIIIGGEQYLGLVPDKYLHNPKIVKDDIGIIDLIQLLRERTTQRLCYERSSYGDTRSLSRALCRGYKTPKNVLRMLDEYERLIK